MLRPPPPQRNQGLISGQITDLIDIDYETLVLLLGVAGAGASWVLYQAILTKGRRAFRSSKQGEAVEEGEVLEAVVEGLEVVGLEGVGEALEGVEEALEVVEEALEVVGEALEAVGEVLEAVALEAVGEVLEAVGLVAVEEVLEAVEEVLEAVEEVLEAVEEVLEAVEEVLEAVGEVVLEEVEQEEAVGEREVLEEDFLETGI